MGHPSRVRVMCYLGRSEDVLRAHVLVGESLVLLIWRIILSLLVGRSRHILAVRSCLWRTHHAARIYSGRSVLALGIVGGTHSISASYRPTWSRSCNGLCTRQVLDDLGMMLLHELLLICVETLVVVIPESETRTSARTGYLELIDDLLP